jgi:hypothetical protein
MWIWIGALIVAFGGLLALWPFPAVLRSRSRARAAVRPRPQATPEPILEPAQAVREPV